jgi:hypothetical protein
MRAVSEGRTEEAGKGQRTRGGAGKKAGRTGGPSRVALVLECPSPVTVRIEDGANLSFPPSSSHSTMAAVQSDKRLYVGNLSTTVDEYVLLSLLPSLSSFKLTPSFFSIGIF